MTLNKIDQGSNRYCGPAVVAALLDMNTDEAAAEFNKLRYKRADYPVTVVSLPEITSILTRKYIVTHIPIKLPGTLFFVLSTIGLGPGLYMAYVTGHVVCLEVDYDGQIFFLDNRTKKPINAAATVGTRSKCGHIYRLEEKKHV